MDATESVEVVNIRIPAIGKTELFLVEASEIKGGDHVIVQMDRGEELGQVKGDPRFVPKDQVPPQTKQVVRKATQADLERSQRMKVRAREAMETCAECIRTQELPMKLIDADYAFDGSRLTFFFTSETRVDFRKLVRDLAHVFRTRIELRQIGVRDEAKKIGGIGCCGRMLCCSTYLSDFVPVSIKMAKDQGLNLSPTKISGLCGRLMCCLNYEEDYYRGQRSKYPRIGQRFKVDGRDFTVVSVNLLVDRIWLEGSENKSLKLSLEDFRAAAKPAGHGREGAPGEPNGDRAEPPRGGRKPEPEKPDA